MASKRTGRPSWDAPPLKKPRADSKLKNLPEEHQETLWLLLHPTDEDTKPYTLEAALVYVQEEHGFDTLSISSLSEWRRWYALKLRMENAAARAEQARDQLLMEDPEAAEELLDRRARLVFKAEALENRDPLSWVRVKKTEQTDTVLKLDERKLALLERKAQAADAAKVEIAKLRDPSAGLSDSERQAIIDKVDEILGLKN